jgi:hypothetical protein
MEVKTVTQQAYDIIDVNTSCEVRIAFSARREDLFRGFLSAHTADMDREFWASRIRECNDAMIALGYGRYA